MSRLSDHITVFVIIISAIVLGVGTVSAAAQDILKGSTYQISNSSIDVQQVVSDLNDSQVPIVASNNPAYDFMAQSPLGFTVYFKKDPSQGGDNIDFQTNQGSISFHTLSNLIDGDGNFNEASLVSLFRQARTRASGIFGITGYQPLASELGHIRNGSSNKFDYASIDNDSQGFNMDASYTVSPQELLEELIVNSPDNISGVGQEFTVTGVHPEQEPDGSISFITNNFSEFPLVFRIPAPVMYEEGDTSIRNSGLHYNLTQTGSDTYELTKVIDPAGGQWLNDPSRLYPVVIDSTVVIGSAVTFNSAATNYVSVAAVSSTAFIVVYENGTTAGDAVVGNISGSGTTITYGTPVAVNATTTNYMAVAKLSSTAFVVGYENGTTAGDAKVGNISSTSTITFGTAVAINAAATNYISVAAASSTAFVVGYENGTTAGDAKVGNISSTSTITFGTAVAINAAATNYISVAAASSTAFVVGYENGTTAGDAVVGNISSTSTITFGTAVAINAAATNYISVAAASSTAFVVGYENGTTAGDAKVGNISSTSTITFGTAVAINAAATNAISVAALSLNTFVATYLNGTSTGNARAVIGAISGTSTLSYGASTTFNSGAVTNMWDFAVSPLSSSTFVIGFESTTTSGQALIGTLSPSFTFSISTTTLEFGTLTPSSVFWATPTGGVTSEPASGSPMTIAVKSSGQNGLIISVLDSGNGSGSAGLYKSSTSTNLIAATGANTVAAGVAAYALYVKNVGSSLAAAAGFNTGTSTTAITTSAQTILSASGSVSLNGTADIAIKASIANTTKPGSYADTITITATGKY